MSDSSVLRIAPGFRLQWEEAQDCHVLLFPEGMIQLSETAAVILQHCTGDCDEDGVVTKLKADFPGEDIESDVLEFLQVALEKGWLIRETSDT